jgi:hypothetical protein
MNLVDSHNAILHVEILNCCDENQTLTEAMVRGPIA